LEDDLEDDLEDVLGAVKNDLDVDLDGLPNGDEEKDGDDDDVGNMYDIDLEDKLRERDSLIDIEDFSQVELDCDSPFRLIILVLDSGKFFYTRM